MSLNYNSLGYLYEDVVLTFDQLLEHFGTNKHRINQLNHALSYFRIFYICGCEIVEFPQFYDLNAIGRIHREHQCHILHYYDNETFLLDILTKDRGGNKKGLVRLDLNQLFHKHDKK